MHEGRIVVDDESLQEGEKVTVLAPGGDEGFEVSAEDKRVLRESLAEAARGKFVDGDALLRELDETN